jgi:uncharacterized membrane protein AbrB (regulator of aidB expression)
LFIGAIGGWLFIKLHVPSAVLLGSLFAVAILNITAGQAYYYLPVRTVIKWHRGPSSAQGFAEKM